MSVSFVNVNLYKTHNVSIKNNRSVWILPSNHSQINYAIEVITIFCYKEKLYKEKESFTEKFHAKGKR